MEETTDLTSSMSDLSSEGYADAIRELSREMDDAILSVDDIQA